MPIIDIVKYYGRIIALLCLTVNVEGVADYFRPDRMQEYIDKRNLCRWESVQSRLKESVVECKIDGFDFEEGPGHVQILRYGPVSLRGGENYTGYFRKNNINGTKWRKGLVGGPVDPHTGKFVGYPPLHVHHLTTFNVPLEKGMETIPFVDTSQRGFFIGFYPRVSADHECHSVDGGTDCFLGLQPPGYGELLEHDRDQGSISWIINDVRELNAPMLEHYLEYAEFFIDELNSGAPMMKQTFATVFVASPLVPGFSGTYYLEPNISSYNFNTFYVPTDMELVGTRAHSHWARGDEFWVVRGTQADLGLPDKQRLDVVSGSRDIFSQCTPFPIPGQDTDAFRRQIELNIQKAAIHHSTTLRSKLDQTRPNSTFLPFQRNRISPTPPEILCKYSAQVDVVTDTSLAASNAAVQSQYREIFHKRPKGYSEEEVHSALEQSRHMYHGVKLGEYYRVAVDSEKAGDSEPRQCHRMDFKAGEFLTIIEFNAGRIQEEGKAEVPFQQHTVFSGHAYFPHLASLTGKAGKIRNRRRKP